MNLTLVICPWHTENDNALRLHDSLKNLLVHEVGVLHDVWSDALKHFAYCLVKFLLAGIPAHEVGHEAVHILFCHLVHNRIYLYLGLSVLMFSIRKGSQC